MQSASEEQGNPTPPPPQLVDVSSNPMPLSLCVCSLSAARRATRCVPTALALPWADEALLDPSASTLRAVALRGPSIGQRARHCRRAATCRPRVAGQDTQLACAVGRWLTVLPLLQTQEQRRRCTLMTSQPEASLALTRRARMRLQQQRQQLDSSWSGTSLQVVLQSSQRGVQMTMACLAWRRSRRRLMLQSWRRGRMQ